MSASAHQKVIRLPGKGGSAPPVQWSFPPPVLKPTSPRRHAEVGQDDEQDQAYAGFPSDNPFQAYYQPSVDGAKNSRISRAGSLAGSTESSSSSGSSSSSSSSSGSSSSSSSSSSTSVDTSMGIGSEIDDAKSDISSLLINRVEASAVNKETETKLAKEILAVVYSDFVFKDDMLPETLLTLTMNKATQIAILDMIKTRQCYINSESQQNNFFEKWRLLEQKKDNSAELVGRNVAFPATMYTDASTSVAGPPKPPDVTGVKVDANWISNVPLLETHAGYYFETKDNNTYAYRLPYEVPQCQAMHAKYWLLVAACRSLNPTRRNATPITHDIHQRVASLLQPTSVQDAVTKIIRELTPETPNPNTELVDIWHCTYHSLLLNNDSGIESQGARLFFTFIHLSDPDINPIVPCFIDAITHVHQMLPPLSKSEEKKYYDTLFDTPSPPAGQPGQPAQAAQAVDDAPEEGGGVIKPSTPQPEYYESELNNRSSYMPSDVARETPPTRWSEVLRDLFAINTSVPKVNRSRKQRRSRRID